jgi:competence protein ComEC
MAHLLAISGLHLSIVAGMLLSLGIWLFGRRRFIYVWLALGGIWIYALLTGMHPPVLRAAIMASLFLAAELLGRQRSAATALAFAAAVMVAFSPRILWDASFQMSFAAMAGLIFIFPLVQTALVRALRAIAGERVATSPFAGFIIGSLSVGLGAVIAVWPLVAYYFGVISPVAPLATLFALPALPGVIFLGALAGAAGIAFLPLGQVIGWAAWLFISYTLAVVRAFSMAPSIEGDFFDARPVWVYYGALAVIIWLVGRKAREKELRPGDSVRVTGLPLKSVFISLLVAALLVTAAAADMPDGRLHVDFLDVGQGDAILIRKGSRQMLVDGGPDRRAVIEELGRKMPFWDRTIDLVVLTHPNADHVTGLVEVLQRYRVGQVLCTAPDFGSGVYDEWLRLLDEKGIDKTLAEAGLRVGLGEGVVMEVLNPPTPALSGTQSDIDNNGIVLHLESGDVSFLLTADAMWEAEMEMIFDRAELKSTVLKIGHHGSSTSTSEEFLAVVGPQVAVISVGEDNDYGLPDEEVLSRLQEKPGEANIYRTDINGTVEFITDGDRLWVRTDSP